MPNFDAAEARRIVLARYPAADVEYDEDCAVWISNDDWTALGDQCHTEDAAWCSAARRIVQEGA